MSIDTNVRYILSGGTGYAASQYNPAAQDEFSLLRVRYHAAMSLVHEMTHVWFLNTLAIDEDIFPFANDKAVITKGVTIGPISANPSVDTMPFGMMAAPWPGVQKHDDWDKFVSASRAKQGINRNVQYAVPMKVSHAQARWRCCKSSDNPISSSAISSQTTSGTIEKRDSALEHWRAIKQSQYAKNAVSIPEISIVSRVRRLKRFVMRTQD